MSSEHAREKLRMEGHLDVRTEDGSMITLRNKIKGPDQIIEEARGAQLERLEGAIYALSERNTNLDARLKEALEELEGYQNSVGDRREEIRKVDIELFRVGQQNALLHKENLSLEQRATKAKALVDETQQALSRMAALYAQAMIHEPRTTEPERALSGIYEIIFALGALIAEGNTSNAGKTTSSQGPTHID